jgi:Bacterial DNA-binding protein
VGGRADKPLAGLERPPIPDIVVKKPATKARKGINPFTEEPTTFKARPARKIVRARPVKAAKDAVA